MESRLETLAARIGKFIDKAEERGAIVGGAAVLREMRSTLELLGKIRGEIDDRPVTQVINVTTSDSWLKMRGILMEIFDAHPEAKRDFLNRMSGVPGALPSGDIIDAEVEDD